MVKKKAVTICCSTEQYLTVWQSDIASLLFPGSLEVGCKTLLGILFLPFSPEDKRLQQVKFASTFIALIASWCLLAEAVFVCKPAQNKAFYPCLSNSRGSSLGLVRGVVKIHVFYLTRTGLTLFDYRRLRPPSAFRLS